jgi:phosphoribosyl-ATP pyrophosphohydrolase/phosphoribosyl-AMP cyclohydrolase
MNEFKNISQINFEKADGLVPAVIQDNETMKVLMVGFMNEEAVAKTQEIGKVTFFSRTKNRLWTKGEESGNFLHVVSVLIDCDNDTLLIKVNPVGPVCHTGSDTCFDEVNPKGDVQFLSYLQDFIEKRKKEMPEGSYTTSLFTKGTRTISQKVGEEAVETIIGAMAGDDENFIYESGDLIYHLIVLLSHKGYRIEDVVRELKKRHS